MLANIPSGVLLVMAVALLAILIVAAVLAVKYATRKPSAEQQAQQAYEDGKRQAELQRAYEAGLNGGNPPSMN